MSKFNNSNNLFGIGQYSLVDREYGAVREDGSSGDERDGGDRTNKRTVIISNRHHDGPTQKFKSNKIR